LKRNVMVAGGKVIVRAAPEDAVAKVRRMGLNRKIAAGGRLTDEERDVALLAILQTLRLLS
jgi:hypothetical protein